MHADEPVLIVGGNRFVGRLLAGRLLAAGRTVTLFNRGNLRDAFGSRVERLRGDRTTGDWERLLAGRRFAAVVDFAAFSGEDARRATLTLEGRTGHYVCISTGQVYLVREGCRLPAREADYDGATIPEPEDPDLVEGWRYGMGKRAAEDVLAGAWRERGFPATRIRIPMVNGEDDYYGRVQAYLRRLEDGGPLLLPGGGGALCRHVYGAEVARAVESLLGEPRTFGRAYNLSQEEEADLETLLGLLAAEVGVRARLVPVAPEAVAAAGLNPRDVSPFGGRWMSRLDATAAREELGFRHLPLVEYLGRIAAAYRAGRCAAAPGYEHRERELRLARSLAG